MSHEHPPPWGRFDDLRSGDSWQFPGIGAELVTHDAAEVPGLLAEVDRLTAAGAWVFGFVAYEAAPGLGPGLRVRDAAPGLPLAWFGVTEAPRRVTPIAPGWGGYRVSPWEIDWDGARHRAAVEAVRARIAAGETYQCNLTTRLTSRVDGDLSRLYADLALAQRGSYNAYLDLGRFVIASASPELFFELGGNEISMRPMKGTAGRGATPREDRELVQRLRASTKERAENVMIVDLVRNDLARVARTGSVRVTSLCAPETYETVHQLTSGVSAELRASTGLADIFAALFPCGSITGAPKASTMELIADLEDSPRGVYCGAIGFAGPPGTSRRARFSVAIRTVVADRETGLATYGTGGGITWSSVPDAEYAELLTKARVLPSGDYPSPASRTDAPLRKMPTAVAMLRSTSRRDGRADGSISMRI